MQLAYFDESGTDGAHGITLISGIIAEISDWPIVNSAWIEQIKSDGLPCFHYADCRNQRRDYAGWNWNAQCRGHLDRLASVISAAPVGGITAAFFGDWQKAVADRPDLQRRFPTAYSFCFEMMITKLRKEMHHHGQPDVILVFAEQQQYQRRALDIWRWHHDQNAWPEIVDLRYAKPADVPGLQMADMLAYETRRHLFKKGDEWRSLPLLNRLVHKQHATGTTLYEINYDAKSLSGIRRLEGH